MDFNINLGQALNNLNEKIEIIQDRFVQSGLYNIVDNALDIGIKFALPDVVDDVIIDVKNCLMENGIKDGVQKIWNNIKDIGKSTVGLVNGNFNSIDEIKVASNNSKILVAFSNIFDFALNKSVDNGKISKSTSKMIKNQKNTIIKNIKNNISEELDNQIKYVEKINEYTNDWRECYNNKDLKGMNKSIKNINKYLDKTIPLENVIKEARNIEIINSLIENTGSFDITPEEQELATALAY